MESKEFDKEYHLGQIITKRKIIRETLWDLSLLISHNTAGWLYMGVDSPENMLIRKGPGTDYGRVQFCPVGVYTIVEVESGKGSTAGWGRLKSGIGWVSLEFCQRV